MTSDNYSVPPSVVGGGDLNKWRKRRNVEIVRLFRKGTTTVEIADNLGITKARISQILARAGISREEGGKALQARSAAFIRDMAHDVATRPVRVNRAIAKELVDGDVSTTEVISAFTQQKANARRRDLDWNLSLEEWVAIWKESGKWEVRGRERDAYSMYRKDQRLGYTWDNVVIALNNDYGYGQRIA